MSNKLKTVKITENELVDLIDGIVTEAIAVKKKQWLAEEAAKKGSVLESKIAALEAKIGQITEAKK